MSIIYDDVRPYVEALREVTQSGGLPDNYIYISHLDKHLRFWILPYYPDTVSDSMASNFQDTNALGRSAPVWTYSNSGPRTVQVELPLHRDIFDDANEGISNVTLQMAEDYLDSLLNALQSIALPKYNLTNKAIEPPLVAMRLGNEVFIKGVVTKGIGITYEKPILRNNKYAKVKLSLDIAEVDPYDSESVYRNGSFRGQTQLMRKGANYYLGIPED